MTLVQDLQDARAEITELRSQVKDMEARLIRIEIAASGITELRRGALWVVGVIVVGAIGFGFSVLTLVH